MVGATNGGGILPGDGNNTSWWRIWRYGRQWTWKVLVTVAKLEGEVMSWEEADTRGNPHPALAQSWKDLISQVADALSSQNMNIQVTNNMDGELISTHLARKRLKRITTFS